MEFYRNISKRIDSGNLQSVMTIADLTGYCNSIYEVMHDDVDHGEINCVWGVFAVHREVIKEGVRFSMPGCPNALAWTVTVDGEKAVLFHLTINRDEQEEEFLESIEEFVDDWERGLALLN